MSEATRAALDRCDPRVAGFGANRDGEYAAHRIAFVRPPSNRGHRRAGACIGFAGGGSGHQAASRPTASSRRRGDSGERERGEIAGFV